MIYQNTCQDTPQQNGVDERKNKTLLEMTRAMMFNAKVSSFFRPKAIATTNYLTNRLPHKKLTTKHL